MKEREERCLGIGRGESLEVVATVERKRFRVVVGSGEGKGGERGCKIIIEV